MSFDHVAEGFIYIFNTKFYEFFFHWSWQVRNIFYHIYLFTVNHRIRNMNLNINKSKLRRGSVGDKNEIFDNTSNSLVSLRIKLIEEYEKRNNLIKLIKQVVVDEKLDTSFNTKFNLINKPEFFEIPKHVGKNIVVSIVHYNTLEKEYYKWEEEIKLKKNSVVIYPICDLEPPRDDVVLYADINW